MRKLVVLDKSYLIAKPTKTINDLCINNDVYMPNDLFLELIYSKEEKKIKQRADSFKKFPKIDNPVILGMTTGELLRYEIIHKIPCPSLINFKRNIIYKFHNDLSEENLNCMTSTREIIDSWRKEVEETRTDLYIKSSAEVYKWFPKLIDFVPGQSSEIINEAKRIIQNDDKFVLNCYQQIKPSLYPDSGLLNENWFVFNYMKTNLFYSINYIKKYGANCIKKFNDHVHNELDIEYCALGIFAKSLASCDNDIKECFQYLCPDGMLLS